MDRADSTFQQAEQEVLRLAATVDCFRTGIEVVQAAFILAERQLEAAEVALIADRIITLEEDAVVKDTLHKRNHPT